MCVGCIEQRSQRYAPAVLLAEELVQRCVVRDAGQYVAARHEKGGRKRVGLALGCFPLRLLPAMEYEWPSS
ncbi:MAG: hypothetical protein SangKO_075950 [Sandaracinaceae bacterium]